MRRSRSPRSPAGQCAAEVITLFPHGDTTSSPRKRLRTVSAASGPMRQLKQSAPSGKGASAIVTSRFTLRRNSSPPPERKSSAIEVRSPIAQTVTLRSGAASRSRR